MSVTKIPSGTQGESWRGMNFIVDKIGSLEKGALNYSCFVDFDSDESEKLLKDMEESEEE